mmetsp:Transcript_8339/g.15729  ORF Transcript_8339/g.15729 Transcript_8339/m.15729 type:complete len:260 (+) Transcript_8339:492-1271(+)
MGETSSGNGHVIDDMFASYNVFNGRNSLSGRSMGKHHLSIGISDAVEVRNELAAFRLGEHLHFIIDGDKATVGFDSHGFQPHIFGIGHTSCGYHGSIHLQGFHVFFGLGINHLNRHRLHSRNSRSHLTCKHTCPIINRPIPNQKPLCQLGNLTIKRGHDIIHGLNERHLRSQRRIHIRKLQPNISRPNNRHPLWHMLKLQGPIGRIHRLLIHRHTRRNKWNRSRCQNDITGRVDLSSCFILDLVRLSSQNSSSLDDIDT